MGDYSRFSTALFFGYFFYEFTIGLDYYSTLKVKL